MKQESKLKWSNLAKSKCPKCGKDLVAGGDFILCSNHEACDFQIREQRMKEIVSNMVDRRNEDKGRID